MKKTITIGNKAYEMKASLKTHEIYKNLYGEELTKVIQDTNEKLQNFQDDVGKIGGITLTCLKIAWVMIKEADADFISLDKWEEELDGDLVGSWIGEVLALAFSPFQATKPNDHKQPSK